MKQKSPKWLTQDTTTHLSQQRAVTGHKLIHFVLHVFAHRMTWTWEKTLTKAENLLFIKQINGKTFIKTQLFAIKLLK